MEPGGSRHAGWLEALACLAAGLGLCWAFGWLSGMSAEHPFLAYARRGAGLVNGLSFAAFMLGLLELRASRGASGPDRDCLARGILPEDARTIIDASYIPAVLSALRGLPGGLRGCRLARMVELCAVKFQTADSVGEVSAAMQMQSDLEFNRLESSLSLVRYLLWVIPSLGFIGTVLGLSDALALFERAGKDLDFVKEVTPRLAYAFDTTFVALVLASVLMFAYHKAVESEEGLINAMTDYCLRNFIGKAYYPKK